MSYKIEWKENALKSLSKLDKSVAYSIKAKVENYLILSAQNLGQPLTGKYKSLYRYRYGDYRVIYKIDKANNTIIIAHVGHRKEIY